MGRIVVAKNELLGRILKVISIHQTLLGLTSIHVLAEVQLRTVFKLEYSGQKGGSRCTAFCL